MKLLLVALLVAAASAFAPAPRPSGAASIAIGRPAGVLSPARDAQTALFAKKQKQKGGKGGKGPQAREKPEKKPKDDCIEVSGKVLESLPNAMFRVEIEPTGAVILCTVSGKIRRN